MILFFSDGRLGNQLFQYAFLNTIKSKNENIIALNMQQFLESFEINNKFFIHLESNNRTRFLINNSLKPLLFFLTKLKLIGYIKQNKNDTSSLPSFTEKKGVFPIRLVETNFFQSECFFNPEKVDFKFKKIFLDAASEVLKQIDDDFTKVFIHVRRGDYLFENFLGKQGIDLPMTYFRDAIDRINTEVENPFFVFLSDDTTFIECCFNEIKNKYISKNSMAVDLALMSLCEYGIVSNSSYSWWGAYLMKNRKKVIFPMYWYGWKSKVESHLNIQPKWGEVIKVTL